MTITNTVGGLEVSPSKKCQICTIQQQLHCRSNTSLNLWILTREMESYGFDPEQLGNGKSFELDCDKFPMKTLEN